MSNSVVIICGNYLNCYSIADSLRAINWAGRIVSIKEQDQRNVFIDVIDNPIEVWPLTLKQPGDIISIINTRIPIEFPKIVFFNDERFHEAFLAAKNTPSLKNFRFFTGSEENLGVILDRYAFCDFIHTRGLAAVPKTIPSNMDPWKIFPGGFFVRVKKTWSGLKKLSRVKMVINQEQLQKIEGDYLRSGLHREDWCYQEILSISSHHNVSISGWHDHQSQRYFATRKILQHPPKTGNGDVCELFLAPEGLLKNTRAILEELNYKGPFELEFVFDQNSGTYKVIELNPRFWMQHGLIENATNHELVKRYVGDNLNFETDEKPITEICYWVNSIYAIYRVLCLDFRIFSYLKRNKSLFVPSFSLALRWLFHYVVNKFPIHYSFCARN